MEERQVIGRKKEREILGKLLKSKDAEFLAVYGRRRVGKTFLIREFFASKGCYMEVTGIKDGSIHKQLEGFAKALWAAFPHISSLRIPGDWDEAFSMLTEQLNQPPPGKKITIFLDELPWMATRKSGLIQALDYYWNRHWYEMSHLVLIVCGSAASWMIDRLINTKGGLHNRLTRQLLLQPFSLKETEEYLKSRSIRLNRSQILDLYMVIGGIPFYLKEVEKGKSSAQIIDSLCFHKTGILYSEFTRLFRALFDRAELNLQIVREIAKANNSLSREDLIKAISVKSGGTLNKRLNELEVSGFLQAYLPYGRKKDRHYRIIDEYTLFYLRWIEPKKMTGVSFREDSFWQEMVKTPKYSNWAGHAFESICLKHADEVRLALGLEKVACTIGSWRYIPPKKSSKDGTQIDLLFDREDGAITICEIKYSNRQFVIDKAYGKILMNRIDVFEQHFTTEKQVFLAFVTTKGLKHNIYSADLVDHEVVLADLFNKV